MSRETDVAWAAGFFDGEGCIHITRSRKGKASAALQLVIVQKRYEPIGRFMEIFPDLKHSISHRDRKTKVGYHQAKTFSRKAANILAEMLPYLTLKREEAEVALEFQANVDRYKGTFTSNGLPEHIREWRNEMAQKLSDLKRSAGATTES